MRKYILILSILFLAVANVGARESLRANEVATVTEGVIDQTVVLSDLDGSIFVQIPNTLRILNDENHLFFNGEIPSPTVIPQPGDAPKILMREVTSFELFSDVGESLVFLDRFDIMGEGNRRRARLNEPDSFFRESGAVLLIPLENEIRKPILWKYDDGQYTRLGGRIEESADGTNVFTSSIKRTGTYTIFDEKPIPRGAPATPLDQVEPAIGAFHESAPGEEIAGADFEDFSIEIDEAGMDEVIPEVGVEGAETTEQEVPAVGEAGELDPGYYVLSRDVLCDPNYNPVANPYPRLDTLPTAPNSVLGDGPIFNAEEFLDRLDNEPTFFLTAQEIANLPEHCRIIRQVPESQYEAVSTALGIEAEGRESSNTDEVIPAVETNPNDDGGDNNGDLGVDPSDLSANTLPQTGPETAENKTSRSSFPIVFALALLLVGGSVWMSVRD